METVPENISFPKMEEVILQLWERIDAFQTSLKRSEGLPEYSFYDGPPFATGLPHYGHILAGTIKDIVTRYYHQVGHHVVRRFGWDTHGLPIEFEIDKELGIKTKEQVLAYGIPNYNAACRSIVMRYANEWERIVKRLGRWIDFQNDYKTMNLSFMESVWWVFKSLYEKGLVYRGFKVMPYSVGCTTPLSNFEANLNYQETNDPSVIVSFPLEDEPETKLVAWTTTPWTLPSNLALCVNPELTYVKLTDKKTGENYILCETRLSELYKKGNEGYVIQNKFQGKELEGKRYRPLFNYFEKFKSNGAFRILNDGYVKDDSGTGVVHQAPAFGEDDYRCCLAAGIIVQGEDIPCPVDDNGCFIAPVLDFAGKFVKVADDEIKAYLKANGRLISSGTIKHSYPFCWRSETPLIYRAVPSWFVAVEKIKPALLENNDKSYWVPDFVKDKRFRNWLVDARDWAISRNRYWGTPIPVWLSDDNEEVVVVGSVDELEALSGVRVTDLHRESIDHITIPSKRGPEYGVLKRIEPVFDCWFESGSMPYAQVHYPFENKELFESTFPADFIAEGLDQTRGWFYTLLVISTGLFNKPAFKNLIVNGLVLAKDGKKMSKRLKNYPDPSSIVNLYGADALRLYLINSPVVRAEPLRFNENGVKDVIKDVFLPWFNAYRFLVQSTQKYEQTVSLPFAPSVSSALHSSNIMDKWILASCQSWIAFVVQEMKAYRLYTVIPRLVTFIRQLTNWYVRFNRKRLKGSQGTEDSFVAINTLYEVLLTITKVMAPFTPFVAEYFYQNLRKVLPDSEREESVHYLRFPTPKTEAFNKEIEVAVSKMQTIIELGRYARDRRKLPLKYPLKSLTVVFPNQEAITGVEQFLSYIKEEMNVRDVILTSDDKVDFVKFKAVPDHQKLGKRLGGERKKVCEALEALSHDAIQQFLKEGKVEVLGHEVSSEEVQVVKEFVGDSKTNESLSEKDVLAILDITMDEDMEAEGLSRKVVNRVQKLRKKVGLQADDPIEIFYQVDPQSTLAKVLSSKTQTVQAIIGVPFVPLQRMSKYAVILGKEDVELSDFKLGIYITRLAVAFSSDASALCPPEAFNNFVSFLSAKDYSTLSTTLKRDGAITVTLDGHTVTFELNKHIFLNSQPLV